MAQSNKKPSLTVNRQMIQGPVIILVEPQLPENIGMAARAMANFGLKELRLVRPRETFPHEKAYASAAKAHHIIDGARLYENLSEAVADLNHLYATTARERYSFKPVVSPLQAASTLREGEKKGERGGILFGRERFGLSNEEISLADEIVTFPVDPDFASLNIAQAVLLMAYEWMKAGLDAPHDTAFATPLHKPANKETLYGLFTQLEAALSVRGYFRPLERTQVMRENLRAVLTRARFNTAEIRLLRGVVSSLDRFSPTRPRGHKSNQEHFAEPREAKTALKQPINSSDIKTDLEGAERDMDR